MPKFFCDYCDVYLTHDSMSVRKAHNSGRNHLRNVVDYYQQIGHEKAQSVIDSITSSYAAEGQSGNNPMLQQNMAPGVGGPPNMGGAPSGMPPMPSGFGQGMPPLPPNFNPAMMPPGMPPMPPMPQGAPGSFPPMPPMPPNFPQGQAGSPGQGNMPPFPPPGNFGPPGQFGGSQAGPPPGGQHMSPPPGMGMGGPPGRDR